MKRIFRLTVLLCLVSAPAAQGIASPATPDQKDSLDTVVVEGTRGQLNAMLQEMVKSEDRFFERYNKLNTNDDFDMRCFREARVGTRFMRRYCIAEYMNRAMQVQGQDYALFLQSNFDTSQGAATYKQKNDPPTLLGGPPVPAMVMIEARREDFRQNMRDVVSRNPELVKMLRERYELGQRYEATRRSLFGPKAKEEYKSEPAAPVTP
jgi:hypothetical protein